MPEVADLGWAAGFIDGDGSISLVRRSRFYTGKQGGKLLDPVLAAGGVAHKPIAVLHTLFGGGLQFIERRQYGFGRANAKGQWWWRVHGSGAIEALGILQPFLVLKSIQCWLAREAWAQQDTLDLPLRHTLADGYCAAMRLLNKGRGVEA